MAKKTQIYFNFLISAVILVALVGLTVAGFINGKTAAAAITGLAVGAVGIEIPGRSK